MIFVDTPGIHRPKTGLGNRLNETARASVDGVDVIMAVIEAGKAIGPGDRNVITTMLDKSLQAINSDYEAKRYKDMALRMPIVHRMPKDGFKKWLKDKGKLGGQHKVPRLSNDRTYLDEMLRYLTPEAE